MSASSSLLEHTWNQWDDSKYEKWVFHQTSILNWLFRVPGKNRKTHYIKRVTPTYPGWRVSWRCMKSLTQFFWTLWKIYLLNKLLETNHMWNEKSGLFGSVKEPTSRSMMTSRILPSQQYLNVRYMSVLTEKKHGKLASRLNMKGKVFSILKLCHPMQDILLLISECNPSIFHTSNTRNMHNLQCNKCQWGKEKNNLNTLNFKNWHVSITSIKNTAKRHKKVMTVMTLYGHLKLQEIRSD